MVVMAAQRMHARDLVAKYGGQYSHALGIDLASGKSTEIYKWFLAAILFGARISEKIAVNTYHEFEVAGVLTPQTVMDTGWDGLVEILDRGGYVRYDYKTATKLLEVNKALTESYAGNLNKLHAMAKDSADLEEKIKGLGKGIGEITVNIFLREMRDIWLRAVPLPSELVIAAARDLRFIPGDMEDKLQILKRLQTRWQKEGEGALVFADFEAALVKYGKIIRKKTQTGQH